MKLAIIDIDGVIADGTARFAKAEEAKKQEEDRLYADWHKMNGGRLITMERGAEFELAVKKQLENVYWRTAFTPDLVQLDTLIDGVSWALIRLEDAGYEVIYLTSRPESMREATTKWFHALPEKHGLRGRITPESKLGIDQLIMKPASQQFVKTVTWKAGVVELLVRLFSVDDFMVIDDEVAIQEAIAALDLPCKGKVTASLAEALEIIG